MLKTSIDSLVNSIITNIPGFTAENCRGFDDEQIFDYILRHDMSPYPQRGCIVSYGGMNKTFQESEFGSQLLTWNIIVSGLFPTSGTDEDVQEQKLNAYKFIDEMIQLTIDDSTLGGQVLDISIYDAEPLMEYVRNGANIFLLISMRFSVMENL